MGNKCDLTEKNSLYPHASVITYSTDGFFEKIHQALNAYLDAITKTPRSKRQ